MIAVKLHTGDGAMRQSEHTNYAPVIVLITNIAIRESRDDCKTGLRNTA